MENDNAKANSTGKAKTSSFYRLFSQAVLAHPLNVVCVLSILLSGCRGGQVDEGCYWGPIPDEKKLEELKAKGVQTIVLVRLNPMPKLQAEIAHLGMKYVHIPTGLFVSPPEKGIQNFLKVARDPAMKPIYVCDQVARDRTQFYAGIYGMVSQNWTAEHASWQMYRNGLRHWWPWFYKFRRIIKNDEQEIHGETSITSAPAGDKSLQ